MCGRYLFQPDRMPEAHRIYQLALDFDLVPKTGEVFPSDSVAVIVPSQTNVGQVEVATMTWGFLGFKAGQLLINARSETVMEKSRFAQPFTTMRCVFPTTGFFEWAKDKTKYLFHFEAAESVVYLGGFYQFYRNEARAVIMTTAPNPSMIEIHDRMPVILTREQIKPWLFQTNFAQRHSLSPMPALVSSPT